MARSTVVESSMRDGFSQTVIAQWTPSVSTTCRRCSGESSEPAALPSIRATGVLREPCSSSRLAPRSSSAVEPTDGSASEIRAGDVSQPSSRPSAVVTRRMAIVSTAASDCGLPSRCRLRVNSVRNARNVGEIGRIESGLRDVGMRNPLAASIAVTSVPSGRLPG